MKQLKRIAISVCLIIFTVTVSAQSVTRLTPVDVRSIGMGASYYTDTETFYSLFANPASISLTGDKVLWPPIVSIEAGGDIFNIAELTNTITDGSSGAKPADPTDQASSFMSLYDTVENFIGEDGFSASARIGGPLTFGSIKNNFGWGFFNTIGTSAKLNLNGDLISFNIPENFDDFDSLINGDITNIPGLDNDLTIPIAVTADINTDLIFGYAYPLDFGIFGTLSIGLSARALSQFSVAYQNDIQQLYESDTDFQLTAIPASVSVGFGLDMGIQYKVLDMIHVALVWQDFYSPVWTNTYEGLFNFDGTTGSSGFKYGLLDPQLGMGASVDIPLEKITANVLSHTAVYANYKDFLQFVDKAQSGELYRDPLLDLAIGAEVVFVDVLALRVGMNQLFPSGGVGLYLGKFKIDFSVHNEELGYIGEDWKQLTFGLSLTIQE